MMATKKATDTAILAVETGNGTLMERILDEGYGPGAWHGPDLKAAIADVTPSLALWRPAPGRHNIAEIVLHHAYCVRGVRGRLSPAAVEDFVLEGEDWFELGDEKRLAWSKVTAVLDKEQKRLAAVVADVEAGRAESPLPSTERLGLVLGVTCHAVYHAGQIQLLKRLAAK
jgi:hypothetical protein